MSSCEDGNELKSPEVDCVFCDFGAILFLIIFICTITGGKTKSKIIQKSFSSLNESKTFNKLVMCFNRSYLNPVPSGKKLHCQNNFFELGSQGNNIPYIYNVLTITSTT